MVCLSWLAEALGAEVLALCPPKTSPASLSSAEVAWRKFTATPSCHDRWSNGDTVSEVVHVQIPVNAVSTETEGIEFNH